MNLFKIQENLTKIVLLRGICTFSTIYESYYFRDRTKWIRTKWGSPVLQNFSKLSWNCPRNCLKTMSATYALPTPVADELFQWKIRALNVLWVRPKSVEEKLCHWNNLANTLAAEMFGVGDFWLKIRVIIKVLSHPWYPRTFD